MKRHSKFDVSNTQFDAELFEVSKMKSKTSKHHQKKYDLTDISKAAEKLPQQQQQSFLQITAVAESEKINKPPKISCRADVFGGFIPSEGQG